MSSPLRPKKARRFNIPRQFAALPFRYVNGEIEVLIITSRDTHQWIICKGNPEKHLKSYQVAAMEAREEAGILGPISQSSFSGFFYKKYTYKKDKKALSTKSYTLCYVEAFLLREQGSLEAWKEKKERKIEWVSLAEASKRLCANKNIPQKKKMRIFFDMARQQIFKKDKKEVSAMRGPERSMVASSVVVPSNSRDVS